MKYKLIIFDLDGTILDTLSDLADSVNHSLKKNGLAERSISEIRSFVGNGIRLLIERSVPENTESELVDRVFNDFREHYKIHNCDKTQPYDGIIEMLGTIKAKGYKTAVLSNKADFAVQELVHRFFAGCFDLSFGEREGIAKKPSPDSVFDIMKNLMTDKMDTVYVGDSEVDIATAVNAGIDCIIVDWGFRDREQLLNCGAERIISSPNEIHRLL